MLRALDKWGLGYLRSIMRRPGSVAGTRHLIVCVADHFEPYRGGASHDVAMSRLKPWCDNYMKAVDAFRDADGCTPKHTFFYPQEEYNEKCLDMLGALCGRGAGEVEIHLHHRNDTKDGLREKLISFRDILHIQHGMLGLRTGFSGAGLVGSGERVARPLAPSLDARDKTDGEIVDQSSNHPINQSLCTKPMFGFVHGNWALCNSRPDGDWCGVNEELSVLAEAGCYADFTFPSAPSPTQPRMVNAIYRAKDAPGRPRGCDQGQRVVAHPRPPALDSPDNTDGESVGFGEYFTKGNSLSAVRRKGKRRGERDGLMLIQGPLGLNWRQRKFGVLPRLENAEISGANPPASDRVDLWVRQGIHVMGRPEWTFVKLHTHGCVPQNASIFLDPNHISRFTLHDHLREHFNDRERWCLHYVTAREMYNIVRAAEDGMSGDPSEYRDYAIEPPAARNLKFEI